jgi:N5-(cytidine 5'-diphosphoramidyl)-L-glutamine hydrolase
VRLASAAQGHAGTRHDVRSVAEPPPWEWPRTFTVHSHHQYAISPAGFPPDLTPLAVAADGTIEAFAHRRLPWRGLMWHPERETPPGPGTQALQHMLPATSVRSYHRASRDPGSRARLPAR